MADQKPGEPRGLRTSVKGPLMFSAFFAALAFVAVLIFASGGSSRSPRFDLAFTAAGIAFIVTLVIAAMLAMSYKDNAEHLGKGSGINLSSRKPSGHGGYGAGTRPGTSGTSGTSGTAGTSGAESEDGSEPDVR